MYYWQGLGAAFMLVTATMGAQAAEKNWTVEGEALKISKSCARSVEIQPGGAGHLDQSITGVGKVTVAEH